MKVLSVTSEMFPLVKTGGLADVAGALPQALAAEGITARTLLPGYPAVVRALETCASVHEDSAFFGGSARLLAGQAKGHDLLVLDAPHLYDRPGNPYLGPDGTDWPDNGNRFAALGAMAARVGAGLLTDWVPDLVHAHDWQAGLAPAYLRHGPATRVKSVVTIHNIAFQGLFAAEHFANLGLPQSAFAMDGVEYYGNVSYLKAGLQYADAITTVSPTYAQEILSPQFGMGMEGLLSQRRDVLHGILNGIDTQTWDPATDPALAARYDAETLDARDHNKRAVEARFGLQRGDGPLYCVITRMTWQKGMDLLAAIIDRVVGRGGRLVVLGSGEAQLESAFRDAAGRHPGRVGTVIGYDDALSHQMLGGADAILVPSRFEPCGLTQLQGLRYGCVPVVARVGGLADTVIDANEAALAVGAGNGVQFAPVDAGNLELTIERVNRLHADRVVWRTLQRAGMAADVSWRRSAVRYAELFRALVAGTPHAAQPTDVT